MDLLGRFRRAQPAADQAPPTPAPRRVAPPPPSRLRRERRALLHHREQRVRDLGGIALEMYRQDRFRQDLVYEQAAQIVALEERLREIDRLLATAGARRRPADCEHCGSRLFAGARFCPSCGQPAPGAGA